MPGLRDMKNFLCHPIRFGGKGRKMHPQNEIMIPSFLPPSHPSILPLFRPSPSKIHALVGTPSSLTYKFSASKKNNSTFYPESGLMEQSYPSVRP